MAMCKYNIEESAIKRCPWLISQHTSQNIEALNHKKNGDETFAL